jgi:hypothetical protein
MRPATFLLAVAVGAAGLVSVISGPLWAADKEPPSCAAITFRPVPSGLSDGEQNAGRYKSHFVRIDVQASVKNGEAQTYYVEVNGKRPPALAEALPKAVETCAKAKRLGAVGTAPDRCIGDKLAVLIDHIADKRYVLLYAHRGGDWHFCSAGAT